MNKKLLSHKSIAVVALLLCVLALSASCTTPVEESVEEASTAPAVSETDTGEAEAEPTAESADSLPPYLDPTLDTEARIDDLLSRMTLDEKIGQMTLVEKGSIPPRDVTRYHIGGVLSGGGGGPDGDNSPAGWHEMVGEYQAATLETELQIPLIYGVDSVHGHSNVTGATIFPHNIGLGATRNPDLVAEIAHATALETLATGIHWNYAPVAAVPRDIRWGRTYEGFGETSDLVTQMAAAQLRGFQMVDGVTDLAHPNTLLGTPKHFVGDGGTAWGSSTTGDYLIDQGDTQVDEAILRDVHLSPYPVLIENGALSIMASFSSWNGLKMHAHEYLLNDVLKGELGFTGFVVSDWEAIDQIDPDYQLSVETAINAGIDMNMVPYDYVRFINTLKAAVEAGTIDESRVDDAVRRILRAKFALGLFEERFVDPGRLETVGSDPHRALARQAVSESLVLLQNRSGALPLSADAERIFVSGISADDLGIQSGGWTIEWQGTSGQAFPGTTVLGGIEALVSADSEVVFDRFGRFASYENEDGTLIRGDVGIVVLGEQPYAEGRGDSNDLTINTNLIEQMAERTDKVIVIILSGRPMIITEALPLADAWVAAWLPGSEGGGVADALFGEAPFSGRLPFSWPRSMDQLPFDFGNMASSGCDAPLFPYGYGLSVEETEPVSPLRCS